MSALLLRHKIVAGYRPLALGVPHIYIYIYVYIYMYIFFIRLLGIPAGVAVDDEDAVAHVQVIDGAPVREVCGAVSAARAARPKAMHGACTGAPSTAFGRASGAWSMGAIMGAIMAARRACT